MAQITQQTTHRKRGGEVKDMNLEIVTDSLGFRLELAVSVEEMTGMGRHKTYEQDGKVKPDANHKIAIGSHLKGDELSEVIAHEAYHLFYSVRPLIRVDEETEATVFGQLVKRIHDHCAKHPIPNPTP